MFQPGSRFWSLNVWGVWLVQYSCLVGAIPQLWILRPFGEPVIQFGRYFDVDLLLQNFEMYAGQSARAIEVTLIAPIAMEEGLRFAIREGGRTVGAGVVAKITA